MDPTFVTLITGCAALAVGSAAVVACSAARIASAVRRIDFSASEIEALSDQTYARTREAIAAGREGQTMAVGLIERLIAFHGHDERVTGLLKVIDRYRSEAREANQSIAAYQEVIVNQGDQIAELRARDLERSEEIELLEVELSATKAALAAEAGQADVWAKTAANLGWHPNGPLTAHLGAAA